MYIRAKTSWYFIKMEVSSERAPSETSYCQIYYFVHKICVQRARTLGRYTTCRRVQHTTFDVKSSSSTGQGRAPSVLSSACTHDKTRIYRAHGCPSSAKRFAGCAMCHFPSRFRPFRPFFSTMSCGIVKSRFDESIPDSTPRVQRKRSLKKGIRSGFPKRPTYATLRRRFPTEDDVP